MNDRDVRRLVYETFVARGHPPTADDLARSLGCPRPEVLASFERLGAGRALILGPNKDRVQVAPPFSAVPTPFYVETPRGNWWGNCAWESLGIAALLECDARIHTTSGAGAQRLEVVVKDGRVEADARIVAHVSVPAARWWEDVGFTCGTLLFFSSKEALDPWCRSHGIPFGAVIPMAAVWSLAKEWYRGRLTDPDWRRLRPEEARASLAENGLTGPFFEL